ncbi:hypothetical protein ARMGADRAFT_1005059, partial [Armillaria gallica]
MMPWQRSVSSGVQRIAALGSCLSFRFSMQSPGCTYPKRKKMRRFRPFGTSLPAPLSLLFELYPPLMPHLLDIQLV